ncbi:hypothetical protein p19 [Rose leaf rosette-associated virus]|uniref:Uncharacterized protein n=1 Tax=Rose leaf rosette-associated virus TaxID=1543207 RepID=A0A088MTG9_9CLOS|nr:hypothetical protein p19 [Rose leaf rosette-associated virus]AIN39545.1 hypothetical protein p19 [Rose leaf rosette-associated virus]
MDVSIVEGEGELAYFSAYVVRQWNVYYVHARLNDPSPLAEWSNAAIISGRRMLLNDGCSYVTLDHADCEDAIHDVLRAAGDAVGVCLTDIHGIVRSRAPAPDRPLSRVVFVMEGSVRVALSNTATPVTVTYFFKASASKFTCGFFEGDFISCLEYAARGSDYISIECNVSSSA